MAMRWLCALLFAGCSSGTGGRRTSADGGPGDPIDAGPPAASCRIYVRTDAPDDTGDGTSWTTAKKSLVSASKLVGQRATPCDIWAKAGTYRLTEKEAASASSGFEVPWHASLYGGFAGAETSCDQRDWQKNETILSGEVLNADGGLKGTRSHVVRLGDLSRLDGFTITKGDASGSSGTDPSGGGLTSIYNNTTATVANCKFTHNHATNMGGAIYFYSGTLTLLSCTFDSKDADVEGGAISSDTATLSMTDCLFTKNAAGSGGAVSLSRGTLTATNVVFSDNLSANQQHTGPNRYGGGLLSDASSYTLTNCLFVNNISSSTMIGPTAEGSAIDDWNSAASSKISNCTFYDPTLYDGGKIVRQGASFGNTLTGQLTISQSIIWGANPGDQLGATGTTVTGSDVQMAGAGGTYPGTGNVNVDPAFDASFVATTSTCIGLGYTKK